MRAVRGRLLRGAALGGVALMLSSCGGVAAATPDVHRGQQLTVQPGSLRAVDVAHAQWRFGVELLQAMCAERPGENLLFSPASAASALGLLYPAATGPTAEQFGAVLGLSGWSPDLVAAVQAHTRALDALRYGGDLDDEDAPDSLQLSNRLWTAPDLQPVDAYLDGIATAFDAEVQSLDFFGDPAGATERINRAVEEDTRGLIEKLFDDDLPPETRAVLTNAMHLKARWAQPFSGTDDAPFATPAGRTSVDMMDGASGLLRVLDRWQAVELPYRDGTLTAVAVLPPEDTDPCRIRADLLESLDGEPATDVAVRLPRLHIEQGHQLRDLLAGLGLPVQGDYSGLGEEDLEISQVVQKTYLDVDEDGTEAAAATGVGVVATSLGPADTPPVVTFDRPFLLVLSDTATHSPLFLAAVYDPSI